MSKWKDIASEADWGWLRRTLERERDQGHAGEGTMERNARQSHNDRIDRLLSSIGASVAGGSSDRLEEPETDAAKITRLEKELHRLDPDRLIRDGWPCCYPTCICEPDAICHVAIPEARAQSAESHLQVAIEALEIVQAKLSVAQSVMLASGHWRNTEGYLTDAALWIERAGSCASEALSLVSQGEGRT